MLYSEDENAELGLEDDWATIDMSDDDEKVEEENLANEGFQTIDTNTNSNDEEEDDDDEADEEERVTNEIEEADDNDDDAVVKEASSELVLEEKPEITDTVTDKNDESDAEEDTK